MFHLLSSRHTSEHELNKYSDALFGGAIFIPAEVPISQRFQVVNDLSLFNADWRLPAVMRCSLLAR